MEEKDFEAKLTKLSHDIEQLDAKIDDKISSLKEESRRKILGLTLAQIRDTSQSYINILRSNPAFSETCGRVHIEIGKLADEYIDQLYKVSVDEFEQGHPSFKKDINRISRAAGLGDIWIFEPPEP